MQERRDPLPGHLRGFPQLDPHQEEAPHRTVQVGGLTTVTGHDQPQEPRRGQGQAPHKPRESREGAEFGDAGEGEERRCPTDSRDLPSAPHYLTALS